MAAQQTRVEVISNNLANMSTTGYNARRAEFADLAYQQAQRPGIERLPAEGQLRSVVEEDRSRAGLRVEGLHRGLHAASLTAPRGRTRARRVPGPATTVLSRSPAAR